MSQLTPPPARRYPRPPRINIQNLNSNNGSAMGSMPPTAQQPYTAQTNYTAAGGGAQQQPYWPPYANPFAAGNFMVKGFEGFVDFTKSGMSFGEKFTYGLYEKFGKWSKKWFTHMFLLFIVSLYSVGGALLFGAIEGRKYEQDKIMSHQLQKAFFKAMETVSSDFETRKYSPTEFNGKLVNTLREHSDAVKTLINSNLTYEQELEQRKNSDNPWTFWNTMFYCGTIYTTIGYGHITPKTTLGQGLTIVYAIIGIPMFLILLADFGKLFTRGMKFLWAYVRRLYYTGTCRQIRKQQQVRDAMSGFNAMYDMAIRRPSQYFGAEYDIESEPGKSLGETPTSPYPETYEIDDEFNLPVSVASVLLISYILVGTLAYTLLEDWSPFESFYFVFISMSTIGFGDFVPNDPIFMMCSIIYLVFGLALTSMFINVVQIKLSDTFKHASAKIGATIGLGLSSEVGDELGGSQLKTPSEIASVHGSRLGKIAEDENEIAMHTPTVAPLTSILRTPRPITPLDNGDSDIAAPPLLPRKQVSTEPAVEEEKKKKKRFFK